MCGSHGEPSGCEQEAKDGRPRGGITLGTDVSAEWGGRHGTWGDEVTFLTGPLVSPSPASHSPWEKEWETHSEDSHKDNELVVSEDLQGKVKRAGITQLGGKDLEAI